MYLQDLVSYISKQARHIQDNLRVALSSFLDRCLYNIVSRDVSTEHYIERRGRATFFFIVLNLHNDYRHSG